MQAVVELILNLAMYWAISAAALGAMCALVGGMIMIWNGTAAPVLNWMYPLRPPVVVWSAVRDGGAPAALNPQKEV